MGLISDRTAREKDLVELMRTADDTDKSSLKEQRRAKRLIKKRKLREEHAVEDIGKGPVRPRHVSLLGYHEGVDGNGEDEENNAQSGSISDCNEKTGRDALHSVMSKRIRNMALDVQEQLVAELLQRNNGAT